MSRYAAIATLTVTAVLAVPPGCATDWDCTLSGTCMPDGSCLCDAPWTGTNCSQLRLKPAPPTAVAPFLPADYPTHYTWGCAPFWAPDGRPCLYFDYALGNWTDKYQIIPANDPLPGALGLACSVSGDPIGPYELVREIGIAPRPDAFDAAFMQNSLMVQLRDGSHLLAYTTSDRFSPRRMHDWEGNGAWQFIGLARATDPLNGPWARPNHTILLPDPSSFEAGIANNPAVVELDDGRISVVYRGRMDSGFGGCVLPAGQWNGTCVRSGFDFNTDPRWIGTEDPFLMREPAGRGYIMISHTFTGGGSGTKAISRDGIAWQWAGYGAYSYNMTLTNGTVIPFARREEPKLLLNASGHPTHLFNAVYDAYGGGLSRFIVQELDYS